MKKRILIAALSIIAVSMNAQIGKRFPSERKIINDPVTGVELEFLTSQEGMGDSKIYQTHNQWTSDGNWIIFRSNRVKGEAMAVNEKTGDIVQVTEGGYTGMLNVARKSMKLYFMRNLLSKEQKKQIENMSKASAHNKGTFTRMEPLKFPVAIVEVDLEKVFRDSEAGKMKDISAYERVCGTTPIEMGAGGDMALDGDEQTVYFREGKEEAARHLAKGVKIEKNFGPRHMGAGPSGIASMNLLTGEIKHVVSVPFQIGHIQCNPWVPGEIVFCWETGGKAPQRTWTVKSDGTGLGPVYKENEHDWVTHEAVITKDEVAIAIMGHRPIIKTNDTISSSTQENPGQEDGWGPSGTRQWPTGLGIVNLRTHEMIIAGQTPSGSGLWHVNGSGDGNWAVGDDFSRSIYLIDRHTREMILLSTGHKPTAQDHPHPTFSRDGTKIEIQSAMLSKDNHSMNICVIKIPEYLLKRYQKTSD
ncbi:hypothetical protein [uncultured Bacteroides sp.]|uniref:hypothetical protein n=1 Tax=uncultured Bacteroides sp. TaxID=162156 RepID=UPI002AA7662E|nr:hypothetical protein [uncultured Bacteroides sp.]